MKRLIDIPILVPTLAVLALAVVILGLPTASNGTGVDMKSVLDDPEWRKSFLGSYGFLSGAEPQIQAAELELLREVIDLMKVNQRAATAMLGQQVGANSSAALDFVLGNLQFQSGEVETAAKNYEAAIEKFPDFRRAHKNLGLLRVQQGSCARALEHLTRAVELGDRDGRNFGLLGFCYLDQENPLAAEEAYRNAVLQQPKTRDWKLGLARALLAMRKHEEAAALFGTLIEDDPGDANVWLLQANAFLGLEQPLAAAVNLEAVRMLGKAQSSSLVLLGDIYMNAGMPQLAKEPYLAVVEADGAGTQFETAYRAADLLVRSRAFGEAGELVQSIASRYDGTLSTEDQLRLLTLEAKLARAEGRDARAAELLESIVQRDGTRGDALLELAAYYRGRGDTEMAVLLIERAEKLEAYRYPALLEHAQVMVAASDYPRAAELLRGALEIKTESRVERFLARVQQAVAPR